MQKIRVVELFAGVGGFRLGLQQASERFEVVWSNQWEPSTKSQDASLIYEARFGAKNHSNVDIARVPTSAIPAHDLLVGGFPCQDYSVARTLNQATGLIGKKGVLWWQIHRILSESKDKPQYILLENVDRLLKSPSKQRGRDFAIMLASLADLGYIVEWRVINAADYGMPQRRRRIFLFGYLKDTQIAKTIVKLKEPSECILERGILAQAFPVQSKTPLRSMELKGDIVEISDHFNDHGTAKSPFANSGILMGRRFYTLETQSTYDGEVTALEDIIIKDESLVPEKYFIDEASLKKWIYLKGAKKEMRVNKSSGFEYHYTEGGMVFPDALDKPSRTIVTGEGGSSPSRFKHVIRTASGRYRRLTPVELERLNMFPDNHTTGASDIKRAFFMGNALVVGIVRRIGEVLAEKA